jgi:hypothetical protein
MTIPYSFIEAQQARCVELREKSLARHDILMHLPQQESQLKRIVRRISSMTGRAVGLAPRPSPSEKMDAGYPPAFSK